MIFWAFTAGLLAAAIPFGLLLARSIWLTQQALDHVDDLIVAIKKERARTGPGLIPRVPMLPTSEADEALIDDYLADRRGEGR